MVKYTPKTDMVAERLEQISLNREVTSLTAPQRDPEVEQYVAQHLWRTVIKYKRQRGLYQAQYINIMEAIYS